MHKRLAILGSTGSIGTQTLEIVSRYPDLFSVAALTAWSNADLLIEQARLFRPSMVVIGHEAHYSKLRDGLAGLGIEVLAADQPRQAVGDLTRHPGAAPRRTDCPRDVLGTVRAATRPGRTGGRFDAGGRAGPCVAGPAARLRRIGIGRAAQCAGFG